MNNSYTSISLNSNNKKIANKYIKFIKRKIMLIYGVFSFYNDKKKFKKMGGIIDKLKPIIGDNLLQAGNANGHYFHQDLLIANMIFKNNPIKHIDIGSRIDGFVAHVASFRNIEIFDIRPLKIQGHNQIKNIQGDLMNLDKSFYGICDSVSCLHALEHFGLGRYGDPIDPDGHIKGLINLHKILQSKGILYLSFPIGSKGKVYFNAHRVIDPIEVLKMIDKFFELIRFDYIDDYGNLNLNTSIFQLPNLNYGCGIFTLKKI